MFWTDLYSCQELGLAVALSSQVRTRHRNRLGRNLSTDHLRSCKRLNRI